MVFKGRLPQLTDLCRIAGAAPVYPATAEDMAAVAVDFGYGEDMIAFIQLFAREGGSQFTDRADFYTRSAELAMLIREEREQPREMPRVSQG